jgi:CRP/FNR family cyclic AMP-dependent transcriptional regulator
MSKRYRMATSRAGTEKKRIECDQILLDGRTPVEPQNTATQSPSVRDGAALENLIATLPIAAYSADEAVLTAGSKSGRLFFLKSGAVGIFKDSIEIATVKEPGAVLGEISALLDRTHTADVRALEDSQFYIADAALLGEDPIAVLHIARILARRLVAADEGLVELKNQLHDGHPPITLSKLIGKIEGILMVDTFAEAQELATQAHKQWPALGE